MTTCEYCRRLSSNKPECEGCGAPALAYAALRRVNRQLTGEQLNAALLGLPPMDLDYLSRPLVTYKVGW